VTSGGTYHLYGLTNELIAVPEPSSIIGWSLIAVSGIAFGLFRRK
jgi:hypothetical protein